MRDATPIRICVRLGGWRSRLARSHSDRSARVRTNFIRPRGDVDLTRGCVASKRLGSAEDFRLTVFGS